MIEIAVSVWSFVLVLKCMKWNLHKFRSSVDIFIIFLLHQYINFSSTEPFPESWPNLLQRRHKSHVIIPQWFKKAFYHWKLSISLLHHSISNLILCILISLLHFTNKWNINELCAKHFATSTDKWELYIILIYVSCFCHFRALSLNKSNFNYFIYIY